MRRQQKPAFTLLEMLIVIAVIGILIALLLPAVQGTREMARRNSCCNNLAQLMMAVQNYESAHRVYPPGTINPKGPIINLPAGYHHNWMIQILPYMQEKNAWRMIDDKLSVYHPKNAGLRAHPLTVLTCPSEWQSSTNINVANNSYAGVHHDVEAPIDDDNHGLFFLNKSVRYRDVSDGQRHTLFVGEKLIESGDLGWMSGTRSTLRNTGSRINLLMAAIRARPNPYALTEDDEVLDQFTLLQELAGGGTPAADGESAAGGAVRAAGAATMVGGFGSYHNGGANFAYGDGHVGFINEEIEKREYQRLGHRADGEIPSANY